MIVTQRGSEDFTRLKGYLHPSCFCICSRELPEEGQGLLSCCGSHLGQEQAAKDLPAVGAQAQAARPSQPLTYVQVQGTIFLKTKTNEMFSN